MISKSLLIGLSSLGLVLGASVAPATAAAPAGGGEACAPEGRRLESITVKPGDAAAERAIVWSPQIASDSRKLIENRRISGPCARSVKAFLVSTATLESGEGFDFDPQGAVSPREAASQLEPAVLAASAPAGHGQFVMATRVDGRNDPQGVLTNYLGLWRKGNQWTVASFSQRGKDNVGAVKPLLTSTVPVKSITYFPAPDTRSGQISLTLQETPRTTNLLGFSWYHPQWFE